MSRIKKLIKGEYPIKLLLGYLLMKLNISHLFIIPQKEFYLKFYPTALSLSLWVNPKDRDDELDFIEKYLKEGNTMLDIGANIGQILLFASQKVKNSGSVIGFEPHPKTFAYLTKNVLNNRFSNIKLFQLALGAVEGEVLFSNKFSDDQNKIETSKSISDAVSVKIERLDTITKNLQKIDLLKIDVEGYELNVFKGAIETLKKTNYVFFESWESHFNNFNYSTSDLLIFLFELDFELFRIDKNGSLLNINVEYISKNCENLFAIKKLI